MQSVNTIFLLLFHINLSLELVSFAPHSGYDVNMRERKNVIDLDTILEKYTFVSCCNNVSATVFFFSIPCKSF